MTSPTNFSNLTLDQQAKIKKINARSLTDTLKPSDLDKVAKLLNSGPPVTDIPQSATIAKNKGPTDRLSPSEFKQMMAQGGPRPQDN